MNRRIVMGIAALGLVAALAGCGGGSSAGAGGGNEVVVNLKNTKFEQASVEVAKGTTVKWVNQDNVDHAIYEGVPDSGKYLFKSKDFGKGKDFSYTFDKEGTYEIFCNTAGHHLLGMKMKVVVK